MFSPFLSDSELRELKEDEINQKISELNRKQVTAYRLGKIDQLTQIETFVTIYRDELRRRAMQNKLKTDDDKDLDQLINVD